MVLLTFFVLELLLGTAELLLRPLEVLLQSTDSAVSAAEVSSAACKPILT